MAEENIKKISQYSIKELRDICQAPALAKKKDDNKVGLFSLNFSIYVTRLFLHTKITPNQITVLSVIAFFIGISLLLFNDYAFNIIGSLIIFFSIILDGCDGEVARFRKKGGNVGALYTEPVSHDIQYGFAFLIIANGLVIHGFPPYYYILGGLAGVSKLLFRHLQERFCVLLSWNKVSDEEAVNMRQSLKSKSILIKVMYRINKNFFNNSGIFIIIFICSLINRIDLALWFFGLGYFFLWLTLFGKQFYQIKRNKIK